MATYLIRHAPELTLVDLAARLDQRLSPPLECAASRPAPWLRPRLIVHGGGLAGARVRLQQGPSATLISIDRVPVNMPRYLMFVPLVLRYVFIGNDYGAWAAVRSFVLESGEFTGPEGGKPQRLFRPGRIWMLGNPGLFQAIGMLKLLVGLGLACFGFYVCAFYDDALPLLAIAAALGGRWIYTGLANLRIGLPSFFASLVPFALAGGAAFAVGYASPPIRHGLEASSQDADLDAQRQKVLAGGPIGQYAWHVEYALRNTGISDPQRRGAKLQARLAEAVQIMVQRKIFLRLVERLTGAFPRLPDIEQARQTNGERLKKLTELMDRKYDSEARALETAVRSRHYVLDESGTPNGRFGKYRLVVRPPDSAAEKQLVDYLDQHGIRADPGYSFEPGVLGIPNDSDPAKIKALLAPQDPQAGGGPAVAELDRKEVVLHSDDPESPYVIVPAQYAHSLAGGVAQSADLKWDEALYRQGKICVQFYLLSPSEYDFFRHNLEAWKPIANLSGSWH